MTNAKKEEKIILKGTVTSVVNANQYKVLLENNVEILATTSGKMRMFRIQILKGDLVDVELSLYDLTLGRIIYRNS